MVQLLNWQGSLKIFPGSIQNPGQKLVHDYILASVLRSDSQRRPQGRPFFVHSPGGTKKSST